MNDIKYKVVIKRYKPETDITVLNLDWDKAIQRAKGSSAVAKLTWTRHPNVLGVIRHMDQYSDLFNEGSIKIERDGQ